MLPLSPLRCRVQASPVLRRPIPFSFGRSVVSPQTPPPKFSNPNKKQTFFFTPPLLSKNPFIDANDTTPTKRSGAFKILDALHMTRRKAAPPAEESHVTQVETGIPRLRDFTAEVKNGAQAVHQTTQFHEEVAEICVTPIIIMPPTPTRAQMRRNTRRTTVVVASKVEPGVFTLMNEQGEHRNCLFADISVNAKVQESAKVEAMTEKPTGLVVPPVAAKRKQRKEVAQELAAAAKETREAQLKAAIKWPQPKPKAKSENKLCSPAPPRRARPAPPPPMPFFPTGLYYPTSFDHALPSSSTQSRLPSQSVFCDYYPSGPLSEIQLW